MEKTTPLRSSKRWPLAASMASSIASISRFSSSLPLKWPVEARHPTETSLKSPLSTIKSRRWSKPNKLVATPGKVSLIPRMNWARRCVSMSQKWETKRIAWRTKAKSTHSNFLTLFSQWRLVWMTRCRWMIRVMSSVCVRPASMTMNRTSISKEKRQILGQAGMRIWEM